MVAFKNVVQVIETVLAPIKPTFNNGFMLVDCRDTLLDHDFGANTLFQFGAKAVKSIRMIQGITAAGLHTFNP
jgi:hypothetical protein